VPFVAGIWAYGFSYAAAFTYSIRWLGAEQVPAREALTYCLLGVISAGVAALAVRTLVALNRGTFLPRLPTGPAPAGVTSTQSHSPVS
jgi:tellurite resistance protein